MTVAHSPDELTAERLRRAYAMFPSGVTAVCALIDGQPTGMAMSSFTSVSLDPPLVSVCIAHSSSTWPVLSTAAHLGISVLGGAEPHIVRQLSAKDGDRFADIDWEATEEGAVYIGGAPLWLDCAHRQHGARGRSRYRRASGTRRDHRSRDRADHLPRKPAARSGDLAATVRPHAS